MNRASLDECPGYLKSYLFYMETIKGRSKTTVDAYYTDIKNFLRYIAYLKKAVPSDTDIGSVKIHDLPLELLKTVTLADIYEYMHYASSERSNSAKTRARKVSSLKTFFNYLVEKANLLEYNPVKELETPNFRRALPKYLTLEESLELLANVDSSSKLRDYCILVLFLNCGMRLSELVGINLSDIKDDTLRILGKGNKERIVYLNDSCKAAIENYIKNERPVDGLKDKNALFISRNRTRINKRRVEQIVEENLKRCGLDGKGYSPHKLRHTAATLLYQHGHVDIRVLKEMLGHVNLGTTEIYTHTSSEQLRNAAESSPLAKMKKMPK